MKEIGRVLEKKGNKLIVELSPSSVCSTCNLCHKGKEGKFILEVLDNCSPEIGNLVSIEISRSTYYKATSLIYLIPLIFFLFGVILGYLLGNSLRKDSQIFGFIFGFLFLNLSFFFVRFLDKRLQKKSSNYIPVATEIVDESFFINRNV